MNMFMHGIEEFKIVRGNTLSNPGLLENDELKKFNVILANPPYSIKSWDRASFEYDPYGRNLWGTPPQGCADYAFQQHIQKSLDSKNGRSVSLWPHGILFRDSEAKVRRKMLESDVVECVISLGANLFYNSSMVSCLLVTNNNKPLERKGKILFIEAVNEVRKEKTISYLDDKHVHKILEAFKQFEVNPGFSEIISIEQLLEDINARLSVQLFVNGSELIQEELSEVVSQWESSSSRLKSSVNQLLKLTTNQ